MINIRTETPADKERIHALEALAFGRALEADLVNTLRDNGGIILSLVAETDGVLIGHILFSPMSLVDEETTQTVVALGPIGVLPTHQRQGVGGALIREGLRQCVELGYSLVFLVGHPAYYPRFGFRPALPLGFDCRYVQDKAHHQHFMVWARNDESLIGNRGVVHFRPEFDVDTH